MSEMSNPSQKAVAVTKSDTTSLLLNGQPPRAIYVAGTGNLNLKFGDATAVLFTTVQALFRPEPPHLRYHHAWYGVQHGWFAAVRAA